MNIDSVTFAKALADDTRQEIMKHLCCVWLSVNDVVDRLDGKVNQPTVSHHLKKLEEANLVLVLQEGRQRFYTLNRQYLGVCCDTLVWTFAPDEYEDYLMRFRVEKSVPEEIENRDYADEDVFTEGKKIRITHLRVERDPRLRKKFLNSLPKPVRCDLCECDTQEIYPWTNGFIEVHHLLPLSSTIAFERQETSLKDLVALC